MAVRIIRVLEYTYPTVDDATIDQARWTYQMHHPNMKMRSVALPLDFFDSTVEDD